MRKRRNRLLLFICLVVAQMTLIFMFSSQTSTVSAGTSGSLIEEVAKFFRPGFTSLSFAEQQLIVASWQDFVRKTAHFLAYSGLGFFLAGTVRYSLKPSLRTRILIAAAVGFLYAASDEFHQAFVPGRGPMFSDVLLDFSGVVFGGLIFSLLWYFWHKHKAKRLLRKEGRN